MAASLNAGSGFSTAAAVSGHSSEQVHPPLRWALLCDRAARPFSPARSKREAAVLITRDESACASLSSARMRAYARCHSTHITFIPRPFGKPSLRLRGSPVWLGAICPLAVLIRPPFPAISQPRTHFMRFSRRPFFVPRFRIVRTWVKRTSTLLCAAGLPGLANWAMYLQSKVHASF